MEGGRALNNKALCHGLVNGPASLYIIMIEAIITLRLITSGMRTGALWMGGGGGGTPLKGPCHESLASNVMIRL